MKLRANCGSGRILFAVEEYWIDNVHNCLSLHNIEVCMVKYLNDGTLVSRIIGRLLLLQSKGLRHIPSPKVECAPRLFSTD
jgi:hypothetical protein